LAQTSHSIRLRVSSATGYACALILLKVWQPAQVLGYGGKPVIGGTSAAAEHGLSGGDVFQGWLPIAVLIIVVVANRPGSGSLGLLPYNPSVSSTCERIPSTWAWSRVETSIDPCCRMPSPPGELQSYLIDNLAEVIWGGALPILASSPRVDNLMSGARSTRRVDAINSLDSR
jgi:hypothetical protein